MKFNAAQFTGLIRAVQGKIAGEPCGRRFGEGSFDRQRSEHGGENSGETSIRGMLEQDLQSRHQPVIFTELLTVEIVENRFLI